MKSAPVASPSDDRPGGSGINRSIIPESDKDVSYLLLHVQRVTKSYSHSNPIPPSSTTGPVLATTCSSTQEPPSGNAERLDVSWVQPLTSQTQHSSEEGSLHNSLASTSRSTFITESNKLQLPDPSLVACIGKAEEPLGTSEEQDFHKIRVTPKNGTFRRDTWSSPTLLNHEFGRSWDRIDLYNIANYFTQPRSEHELDHFLETIHPRFPPQGEWIWPLLPQFRRYRGKDVVVLLLQCPKHEQSITRHSDDSCFTDVVVSGMEKCKSKLYIILYGQYIDVCRF